MGNSQGKPVVFTDEVNLNHFRLLRVVGKGAFGKVRIVERKDSGLTFALKYIRKDEVVRSESVRNIIRERRMLEHLNHPFLCNLRYSFQDIEYLYIVVDLMTGGDLRFHISRKAFTEDAVGFWMAELGCALRYIHLQGIVHRDLKPDNVLLDSEGHVHLADFNVASDFKPGKNLHSKSGTLAYLAPEVFEGVGYSCEVDWWSLGVTFYECIYNKRPFEAKTHEALGETIMKAQPRFWVTTPPVSMPCLHAMSSLLERDRSKRIGAIGFETFSTNPFFASIDFQMLEAKQIPPIFIPSSEKTNFDATYDLEELLLEEAPLEARARRQKPRAELKDDATEKEIREDELHKMIERLFEPFDYTTVSYSIHAGEAVAQSTPEEMLETRMSGHTTTGSGNHGHSYHRSQTVTPTGSSPPYSPERMGDYVAHQQSQQHSGNQVPMNVSGEHGQPMQYNAPMQHHPQAQHYQPMQQHNAQAPQPMQNLPPHMQQPAMNPQMAAASQPTSHPTSHPAGPSQSFSRPLPPSGPRPKATIKRQQSKGGGVQMVLDESSSWSELADQSSTLPADGYGDPAGKGGKAGANSGMLGFLSRKKGRDRSPKPTEPGVLGKDGARQIIN